jgi:hypothetical protein
VFMGSDRLQQRRYSLGVAPTAAAALSSLPLTAAAALSSLLLCLWLPAILVILHRMDTMFRR